MPLNKWQPNGMSIDERRFLEKIPKATLYVLALNLANQTIGRAGQAPFSGAQSDSDGWATGAQEALCRLAFEWQACHAAGQVPQKLPRQFEAHAETGGKDA